METHATKSLQGEDLGRLLCGYLDSDDEATFVLGGADGDLGAAPIVYANEAFLAATGYRADAVVGHPFGTLYRPGARSDSLERLWRPDAFDFAARAEVDLILGDGTGYLGEVTLRRLARTGEEGGYWLGRLRLLMSQDDLSADGGARRHRLALTTPVLFEDRLQFAMAQARRYGRTLALLLIDLAQSRLGDIDAEYRARLIQTMGARLTAVFREGDSVAHLGAMRFAMLATTVHATDAARIADKLLQSMGEPVRVANRDYALTPRVGIAVHPDEGESVTDLLSAAAEAAESAEPFDYRFHAPALDAQRAERRGFEEALRAALREDQLELHYQPLVDAEDGGIVAIEAFLRWRHPAEGLLPAERILPVAQGSDLILDIGEWVLRRACADCRRWHEAGHTSLQVSVNLSLQEVRRPDLSALIRGILAENRLDPPYLQLELPDTAAVGDIERTQQVLAELNALGVRLSIDISTENYSFGVVPASALKRLPIHRVKLGRTTVADLDSDVGRGAVAEAAIAMAHSLNFEAVAGGVETKAEVGGLQRRRIDVVQGYLVSRPLPAEEMDELLARDRLL